MHGSIAIKKQDQNNTIDELKSNNQSLEKQIGDLKKQLQSLQKINETLEYTKRHSMQSFNQLEEDQSQ